MGAELERADLYMTDLPGANLHGANLMTATLVHTNLEGANPGSRIKTGDPQWLKPAFLVVLAARLKPSPSLFLSRFESCRSL
jgi:uncharacterized protein YjbI with pentapeptide repeats